MKDYEDKVTELRKKYPHALIHKILVFGVPAVDALNESKNIIPILSSRLSTVTSMGTVMCDITTDFLAELAVLAITREMGSFKSPGLMELEHPVSAFQGDKSYNGNFHPQLISRTHSPAGSFGSSSKLSNGFSSKSGSLSLGLNDRAKSKQHGRSKKYLADLYLLSGRWQDALRVFSEAATSLKSAYDHLWFASALEGIGICLLLLSFLEAPVSIPPIALQATHFHSHHHSFSDSTESLTPITSGSSAASLPPPLFEFLPELTNATLRYYSRSQGTPEESVPQVVYCETILRFANLLAVTRLSGGWNPASLSAVVRGTFSGKNITPESPSISAITSWCNRAYSTDLSNLPIIAQCNMFGAIASIYSNVGLIRKRSFIMREFLLTIIPRIAKARNVQASKAGVHADSVSVLDKQVVHLLDGEREGGIIELLDNISKVYGAGDVTSIGYGWIQLRVSFLKTCLGLCETIPDFNGIIHFAGLLLSTSADVLLEKEQLHIYNLILRAVESARRVGQGHVFSEFWDPNLLRDIKIVSTTSSILPQYRSKPITDGVEDDVFLHNPFAAKRSPANPSHPNSSIDPMSQQQQQQQPQVRILVQNERADFSIRLQNPFAFDLHIHEIALLTENVTVNSSVTNLYVSPFSIADVTIPVVPETTGKLKILGASIQVAGCAKNEFLLNERQVDLLEDKVKVIGRNSGVGHGQKERQSLIKHRTVEIDVITAQPVMVLKNISINQGWMMLLEGERQILTVTLANISDIDANYVSLKFSDSTTQPLQVALSNKELAQNEVFEIEYFLFNRKALQWIKGSDTDNDTSNNQSMLGPATKQSSPSNVTSHNAKVFHILVLGKRGMTDGTIQVEYANRPDGYEKSSPFWLRTLSIPLNITVNSSIELGGCDMMGLQDNQVFTDDPSVSCARHLSQYLNILKERSTLSEYCLLVVDLRNSLNQSVEVTLWSTPNRSRDDSFEIEGPNFEDNQIKEGLSSKDNENERFTVREVIHAGKTARLLVPVKRVEFTEEELERPVPNLSKRQFVVGANTTPEKSRSIRENFWYRQALLSMLGGTWKVVNGMPRSGILELRGIRLTKKMINILQVEPVSISMFTTVDQSVDGSTSDDTNKSPSPQSGEENTVKAEEDFVTIHTTIKNNTSRELSGYLRIIPSQRYADIYSPNSSSVNATDRWSNMDSKILYNGSLQQSVLKVKSGEEAKIELGILFMSRGEYEFSSVFDEFRIPSISQISKDPPKSLSGLLTSDLERHRPRQHGQRDPIYVKVI